MKISNSCAPKIWGSKGEACPIFRIQSYHKDTEFLRDVFPNHRTITLYEFRMLVPLLAVDPTKGLDMTVLKPRIRRICVRLSEEEYIAMTNLCQITGARSVSDLTRDAMSDFLEGADPGQSLGNRLETFSSQLEALNRKVTEIADWIQSYLTDDTGT